MDHQLAKRVDADADVHRRVQVHVKHNDAAGRPNSGTLPPDAGGQTLTAGVYRTGSVPSLGLTGNLTLDAQGVQGAVFIFQIASTLTTATASSVTLINGAQACNVYWQVSSSATLGTTTAFKGNILALTSISVNNGANVEGRLLARNGAVTLINDTVTRSQCSAWAPSRRVRRTISRRPPYYPLSAVQASGTSARLRPTSATYSSGSRAIDRRWM